MPRGILSRRSDTEQISRGKFNRLLRNVIEADHGKLKRRIKPTLGFKSMKTAYATIKGFELMHALRKGQAKLWMLSAGIRGEVRLVERAFRLGPSILTEAMQQLEAASA